jgi:di/tricarboxylate transporter
MSWIKRHLNWSLLLAFLLIVIVLMALIPSSASEDLIHFRNGLGAISWTIVAGWVLRQKKRSLCYLLLLFIPIVGELVIILIPSSKPKIKNTCLDQTPETE